MINNGNNFVNPMMGMFGGNAPNEACGTMPPQDMTAMCMQWMTQMIQGQIPQIMMQWFQQMMSQMQMNQQGQPQTPSLTSDNQPSNSEGNKGKVDEQDSKDELLTKKEVAALLKTSDTTLWRRHRDGVLMYHKEGGRDMYRKIDVINYINSL